MDLPAVANFAVKFDGLIHHQDATVKNPLSGQTGWNYHNTVGGRASARWTPVDGLTVDLSYDYTKDENTPNYSQLINYNPKRLQCRHLCGEPTEIQWFELQRECHRGWRHNHHQPVHRTAFAIGCRERRRSPEDGRDWRSAAAEHRQDPRLHRHPQIQGHAGSGAAVDHRVARCQTHQWDNSGGAHRTVFSPFLPGVTSATGGLFSRYSLSELFQNQFSQEFQVVGNFGHQLDYVLGAYYFHEDVEEAAATPSTNRWNADGTGYTILSENGNGVPQPPFNCGNVTIAPGVAIPAQGWDRDNWCVQRHSTRRGEELRGIRPGNLDSGGLRHFPPDRRRALDQGQAPRHP